jgi:AraC family transcriptional regulator of adaptative response/methylated-DNA-[protein]-cysteine methyltransferase
VNNKPQKTNVVIDYGFFDTPVGVALIAATGNGVCALRIGTDSGADEKFADVRREFPDADFRADSAATQPCADQLIAFLSGRADTFRPPLDMLVGTPFQRAVWDELQRIAPGERISYTELAARVGRPSAVRAVAGACASNGVAVAIPCHRVLRADGALAGYRWGREWKHRLLDLEAQMAASRSNQNK